MTRFPKSSRILKRAEFNFLLKTGKGHGNAYFALRWQKGIKRRLGIVVARTIQKAVQRNRIKRVVREFFRSDPEKFPLGDVIVIARGGLDGLSSNTVCEKLNALLERKK